MDLKNIIAAVSLSASVIIIWGLFFVEPPKNQEEILKEKDNGLIVNKEAPKIEEEVKIKKISREDAIKSSSRIYFENEKIKGSISLTGGVIDDFEFKNYDKTLNSKEKIRLLNPMSLNEGYSFNVGWATNSDTSTPRSNTVWNIEGNNKLTPNNPVKIYYENEDGIKFERLISLDENYLFNIKQTLINNSEKSYKFYPYGIINRNSLPEDLTDFYILHEGFSIINGDGDVEEVDYDDVVEKPFSKEESSGYLVVGDKYWMTSIIPDQSRKFRFDISYKKNYTSSYIDLNGYDSRPNTVTEHSINSLIGAKDIKLINKYKEQLNIEKLDLIINYGILYFIIVPMHKILDYFYNFTGNYGWSIILLTVLVRVVFFPLNQYSMKSMGKMRSLAPQLESLKAQYKTDKVQLQKATMQLYKANKINPASSCFPVLIQLPIFFSLYKLLLLDLAMRHSPWIWIWSDLSAKDPLSVFNLFGLLPYQVPGFLEVGLLPILMGGSMWLQMRLSPQPSGSDEMQKIQKKLFSFFPLIITIVLAPFAAGLILYWVATNCLTIIQQYIINRTITVK